MEPLVEIGRWLQAEAYHFVVPTPLTHQRVNARADAVLARSVRDVFGWNRPFRRELLPAGILDALRAADVVGERDGLFRTKIRFATLAGGLYVHSGFPTDDHHAVFFGPDTYRFCAALRREVRHATRLVDIGCGSGAGALSIADRCDHLVLVDPNPLALAYARVNAALAGVLERVELVEGELLDGVTGAVDLAISNPPYIADEHGRLYCHGGGALGTEIALKIFDQARQRAARVLLYSGAPVVDGVDTLHAAISTRLAGDRWRYEELDPDVFGEELDRDAYAGRRPDRRGAPGHVSQPRRRSSASPLERSRSPMSFRNRTFGIATLRARA